MRKPFEKTLAGEDLLIDPAAIERTLSEIWRQEGRGSETGVTRAALWNVIVYARNEAERLVATEVLAKVSAVMPQRTIAISAESEGADRLDAWIGANCHWMGDDKQMCSEEVTITASGDRDEHVASLVRALLLPDMPVALWWIGDPPGKRDRPLLVREADRLLIDTRSFSGPKHLTTAMDLLAEMRIGGDDLQWARIEEWRQATAAIFDCPAVSARSSGIRSVVIRYAATAGGGWGEAAGGWLLAGWLRSALAAAADISFRLEPIPAEAGGHLLSVDLDFGAGARTLIERADGAVTATPRGLAGAAPVSIRLFSSKTDHLVRRSLRRNRRNRVYESALAAAAAMAGEEA